MLEKFYKNTKKPNSNFGGRLMIKMMNKGHKNMADWARTKLEINKKDIGLDIGCGGGQNLKDQIQKCSKMIGVDYSEQSVEFSKKHNSKELEEGKIEVYQANVSDLPFKDNKFDFVTAYETIYFWPDIVNSFKEVNRVLKNGGKFLISNEIKTPEQGKKWSEMIGFEIYYPNEIKGFLIKAGFKTVEIFEHENDKWICLIGEK